MIQKTLLLTILFFSVIKLSAQDTPNDLATDVSQFSLFPGNITVVPGATVNLHVYYEPRNNIGKIITIPNGIGVWLINGHDVQQQDPNDGNLSVSLDGSVVYKAPPSTPSHNPVQITVTLKDIIGADSLQWKKTKPTVTLYAYITILDEPNYFYIGSSGTTNGFNELAKTSNLYLVKEPLIRNIREQSETAVQANDQWNIHVNGIDANGHQVTIQANFTGSGVGSYPWKVDATDMRGIYSATGASVFALGGDASSFHYISTDCQPHGNDDCKPITLPGTITIKTFDTKNKIMRGYFYGQMRNGDQYMFVSGGFSVFMQ